MIRSPAFAIAVLLALLTTACEKSLDSQTQDAGAQNPVNDKSAGTDSD
jgi:hypothetical protein